VEYLRLICEAHARMGVQVAVATLEDPGQKRVWPVPVIGCGPGAGSFGYRAGLTAKFRRMAESFDLIVFHGLWEYSSICGAKAARSASIPYFFFPHGMLDPWFSKAFPLKHLKKQLYWFLFERRLLQGAKAVIFTSENEFRLAAKTFWPPSNYRKAIVALGVRAPEGHREQQRELFLNRFPHLRGKRFLLFLGRLHPKKGCDLLIEAFARLQPPLELVLAGPSSTPEYLEELRKMAGERPVTFTGMITGEMKSGALAAAEALILPSHQENFGLVVAEALSFGLPVLLSSQVNISDELEADGAGLVEPDTLSGTCALIERWLAADSEAMREAAQRCYQNRFGIERSAEALLELFANHV
jgi:glycosyltransferase involved in cell wall biosynthesis